MEKETKIVFINEDILLIMEIAPKAEVKSFLNGILFNLTLDNISNEQPIKVTCEGKNRVIDFLERKYSKVKQANRLIKFFRDLPVWNYIYIYLYNEQCIEWYDTFKESLLYYNKGESVEAISIQMKKYMEGKENIHKYLDADPYGMKMIIPEKKVVRGEKEKQKRTCIYCGGNISDGKTKFREIAHAIPEALGNNKFIQNEECDTCNDFFAANAEEDLCNFLIWKRLHYGLKGKKGYPIFQLTNNSYARFFDYKKENYDTDWGHFEVLKAFIKENEVIGSVVVSTQKLKDNENIEISYVKNYIPQHIYKTLVKCVIGLIGNECLDPFVKTINWLRYGSEYIELPKVLIKKCKRLILEPELYIFQRKVLQNYNIPYCYGELRILDTIFIFIIPFVQNDKYDFVTKNECDIFMKILSIKYGEYTIEDFSSIVPKKLEEQFVVCKQMA